MAKFNLTDEYLNKSFDAVVNAPQGSTRVCYALSCRQGGMLCGVADILDLLTDHCLGPVKVRGKSDGDRFGPGEVVLTMEGMFADLLALETLCTGILALSVGAGRMGDLVEAAGSAINIVDACARRFPPEMIAPLAVAAAVGGANGTITQAGQAAALERFGVGGDQVRIGQRPWATFGLHSSVPHALAGVYAGNTTDAAVAFHGASAEAALNIRLSYDGRERDVCASAALRFGSGMDEVHLDTPPDRLHQGGHEKAARAMEMRILSQAADRAAAAAGLEQYGFGPGVTIEAVYAVRDLLDSLGARSTRIVASGGFNAEKLRAFRACHAPLDGIEVDDWPEFGAFDCTIMRVFEGEQWVSRSRAGAASVEPEDLPLIFDKPAAAPLPDSAGEPEPPATASAEDQSPPASADKEPSPEN